MALIKCKECGAEISDKADFCPRCGYKNLTEQPVTENVSAGGSFDRYENNSPYQNGRCEFVQQYPKDDTNFSYKDQSDYNNAVQNRGGENGGKVNVFGIIGLVLAFVSFLLALWGIVAITGLVFSIIGTIYGSNMPEKKTSLAISGIILNSISILYTFTQIITLI